MRGQHADGKEPINGAHVDLGLEMGEGESKEREKKERARGNEEGWVKNEKEKAEQKIRTLKFHGPHQRGTPWAMQK